MVEGKDSGGENGDKSAEVPCSLETVYSLEEAFQLTGHGNFNRITLLACCVINNAVALDMFGFSVVLAASNCDLKLGLLEIGALASTPFCGAIFAFPWGYFADTRGRRRALLLSTTVGFIFSSLTSFAWRWEVMFALKIVACAFSSASFSLTMTYLGECTDAKRRNQYLYIMSSMNLASEIVSFGLAYFLLPLSFNIPIPFLSITFRPWRLYTLVMALELGLGALMLVFLVESPKYLADRGEMDETIKVLNFIYESNGGKKGEYPVRHLKADRVTQHEDQFWKSLVQQTTPIFRPPLLWTTLQLFFLLIVCTCTGTVLIMWYATIVDIFFKSISGEIESSLSFCGTITSNINTNTSAGDYVCNDSISNNTIYSGILLGLFYTCLTMLVSKVATYRRMLLITTFSVSSLCSSLLNFMTHPIAVMIVFFLMQGTVVGLGSTSTYFVDLYPTTYRGLGTSLGMMTARLCSLAGVNLIGAVLVDYCSVCFYSWSVFILCGVIVAFFLPADKKNI